MTNRERETKWEKQNGIGHHLATLLRDLNPDENAKKIGKLYDELVRRLAIDLVDASSQMEIIWAMMNIKQTTATSKAWGIPNDVLITYLLATHPKLEKHRKPLPPSWDELKATYLEKKNDENETPSLF